MTAEPLPVSGALPVFGWNEADRAVYATRRQLASDRLAPGGPVVARLVWREGRREGALYLRSQAKPKRVMTWPQIEALGKALAARRFCLACRRDVGYCLPRRYGHCFNCQTAYEEKGLSPVKKNRGEPVQLGEMNGYIVAVTSEDHHGTVAFWWHAWSPAGSYAGQANDPGLLALLIARHRYDHT
ncbi:RRQRL motif-containing zinc-binding protein [Streptomyces sp. STR69]|uniref:RRQRL motif-containing zinc-binding protein n=1 Tax=Streptomyces sp. STR69 TaxID=1796942 RepID=UPI0021C840D5|nr:RRQRL motif-containing zinc-binding protein [Streptomyces sp. STR69]